MEDGETKDETTEYRDSLYRRLREAGFQDTDEAHSEAARPAPMTHASPQQDVKSRQPQQLTEPPPSSEPTAASGSLPLNLKAAWQSSAVAAASSGVSHLRTGQVGAEVDEASVLEVPDAVDMEVDEPEAPSEVGLESGGFIPSDTGSERVSASPAASVDRDTTTTPPGTSPLPERASSLLKRRRRVHIDHSADADE